MLYDLARTFVLRRAPTPNTFIGTGSFSSPHPPTPEPSQKIDERAAIKSKPDTLGKVRAKMWINHLQHFFSQLGATVVQWWSSLSEKLKGGGGGASNPAASRRVVVSLGTEH